MTNKFSIKDLERLSGIKAHTIRIWEQRYNLLHPHRTDTNIRYYSNDDLKLILNVSLLNNHGLKISKIAGLNSSSISQEVSKITNSILSENDQMNHLIVSLIEMDEDKFEQIINKSVERIGFRDTVLQLIYPFLEKIGVMWQTNTINPAQEHFISNLIRQKFIIAIDKQKTALKPTGKKVLLFLPEGELHEMSLLFYNYIVREQGHKSYYLGQSVPFEDLKKIAQIIHPDVVVSVITGSMKVSTPKELAAQLSETFSESIIYLSGYQLLHHEVKNTNNLQVKPSGPELVEVLNNL